jgi:hypothetical protein
MMNVPDGPPSDSLIDSDDYSFDERSINSD